MKLLLASIQALLSAPNPDDPLAENIAKHWKSNEAEAVETGECTLSISGLGLRRVNFYCDLGSSVYLEKTVYWFHYDERGVVEVFALWQVLLILSAAKVDFGWAFSCFLVDHRHVSSNYEPSNSSFS